MERGAPPLEAGPATVAAAAQVFVDDLHGLELDPADAHHFARVLRLRRGEVVVASDGRGRWRTCRYGADADAGTSHAVATLVADGPVRACGRPQPAITVAFVPAKGERPEWVVQKLTETGVDRIVVLRSRRAVVRWNAERAAHALERLARVAREAAAQSRTAFLPEVTGPLDLAGLAALVAPCPVAIAERGGAPPDLAHPAVAVGPEGGWDQEELPPGVRRVGLGPGVLRAETAAVGAGILLCALRSGVVAGTLPSGHACNHHAE